LSLLRHREDRCSSAQIAPGVGHVLSEISSDIEEFDPLDKRPAMTSALHPRVAAIRTWALRSLAGPRGDRSRQFRHLFLPYVRITLVINMFR
jgi:hypothetical protein